MKPNVGSLVLTVILTLGVVYWLHPLPVSAVIVIGLLAYGVSTGITLFVSKLFKGGAKNDQIKP